MKVEIKTETKSDGTEITRRYEDGVFVREFHTKNFSSGKRKMLDFDSKGILLKEFHSYGVLEFAIEIEYKNGIAQNETYFHKKRLINRKKYENIREEYPDMPSANSSLEDFNDELLKLVKEERKEQNKIVENHVPNLEEAKKQDDWCLNLIKKTNGLKADTFFVNRKAFLGEWDRKKSRKFLTKLNEKKCGDVFCCNIDDSESPYESSSELVIQLPNEKSQRKAVFKMINKIQQDQGFEPTLDNGQVYCFVKLD